MRKIRIQAYLIESGRIPQVLKKYQIHINSYAHQFFQHARFDTARLPSHMDLVICSLSELGLAEGGVLEAIMEKAHASGLRPCHPATGLFLRLQYTSQRESAERILTGTHRAPEGAITVLSEFLEQDDGFPKGLYLRNVDGALWLRGYVCDSAYTWSANDVFVFAQGTVMK